MPPKKAQFPQTQKQNRGITHDEKRHIVSWSGALSYEHSLSTVGLHSPLRIGSGKWGNHEPLGTCAKKSPETKTEGGVGSPAVGTPPMMFPQ